MRSARASSSSSLTGVLSGRLAGDLLQGAIRLRDRRRGPFQAARLVISEQSLRHVGHHRGYVVDPAQRALYTGDEIYEPGVFYCKDAFEGLAVMDQLVEPERREQLVGEIREAARKLRENPEVEEVLDTTDSSVRSAARTDVEVPEPPFWGVREIEVDRDELYTHLDTHVLFKLHWGGRGVKGEQWRRLLAEDFRPPPDGFVATRARQVLAESIELLERICDQSLLTAIAEGTFGVTRRPADGGKGADGVIAHGGNYVNPATELLEERSR